MLQRLGKNIGRYLGEQIDIDSVLGEIHTAAEKFGWESDTILDFPEKFLRGYRRHCPHPRKKLYLSSGIHGDEPAGPLTILEFMRDNEWPENVDLFLCPCLNPAGFRRNTRENEALIDLNRDYRHLTSHEVRAHVAWLEKQPVFDLAVILHEDWEANGYYVYELNPNNLPSLAEKIIDEVREICPIETAETVDSWKHEDGIIRPQLDAMERPQWAESVWLTMNKAKHSYTLEAPSDFSLAARIAAHGRALRTIFASL